MKNLLFLVINFLLFTDFAVSQNFLHEFGKYSNEEFQMQSYKNDRNAEAVVIYDIGKSYFVNYSDYSFQIFFERKIKIKIFNKAGIKWAQFDIPFYEENNKAEEVIKLEGNTYNFENGQVRCSPLDTKNTYVEKVNKNWSNKKFAMPDVKEGSVIEVRYTIRTPYFFNFRSWDFQTKIPVIYSEYTTKMIPLYTYTYILQGANKFSDFKQYVDPGLETIFGRLSWKDMVYVFVMKDIPAFNDESFITTPDDYIIKLDFQLSEYTTYDGVKIPVMDTWPKMVKDIQEEESFGGYIKSSQSKTKEIIDTMHLELVPLQIKVKSILEYVKSNYNWNGSYSKFASQKAKEFYKTRTGNSADINLFLIGILKSAGVDVNPVIISTRGHGKIKSDYPFQHFFNYVIATTTIDGQCVNLDATDPLCNFGMLPSRCLNDKGLVIKKGKEVQWLNFSSSVGSSKSYDIELIPNIDADSINGNVKVLSTGYDALSLRRKYFRSKSELKDELISDNHTLCDSIRVQNLHLISEPFIIEFKANTGIDIVEDKILISPFYGYTITDNPLKQTFRFYPIDMTYREECTFNSTIQIPKGYKLFKIPESLSIDNENVKITYVLKNISENQVKVVGTYEFKKDIYSAESYSDLKRYFNKIIEKFNEKLILVKF